MKAPQRPFIGGVYRHYKGDLYTVIGFAYHHHTREEVVIYRSAKYGWVNVRPLNGSEADPDGWLSPAEPEGRMCARFEHIPEAPDQ